MSEHALGVLEASVLQKLAVPGHVPPLQEGVVGVPADGKVDVVDGPEGPVAQHHRLHAAVVHAHRTVRP